MGEQDGTNAAHWLNREVQLQLNLIYFLLNIFFIGIVQFCKRKIVIIILSLNILTNTKKQKLLLQDLMVSNPQSNHCIISVTTECEYL